MRRNLVRAARFLVLPTIALVVVAAFAPGRTELAVRIYALVLSGVVLVLLLAVLRRAYPRPEPLRERRRPSEAGRTVPGSLRRFEQEVALGAAWSFDLHHRLRPHLRSIASELLASRRRLRLDDDQERSQSVLGEEAWELVRPHRPPPDDRQAPGVAINDLEVVVESLERL